VAVAVAVVAIAVDAVLVLSWIRRALLNLDAELLQTCFEFTPPNAAVAVQI
jgi:hypothetical protein